MKTIARPGQRTVSSWWRTVSIGLAVGLCMVKFVNRRPLPKVFTPVRTLQPTSHDPGWNLLIPWDGESNKTASYADQIALIQQSSHLSIRTDHCSLDLAEKVPAISAASSGECLRALVKSRHLIPIEKNGVVDILPVDRAMPVRCYDVRRLLTRRTVQITERAPGLYPIEIPKGTELLVDDTLEDLKDIIIWQIDHESWKDAGGGFGEIHGFAGILVVKTTEENHRLIAALLAALRPE